MATVMLPNLPTVPIMAQIVLINTQNADLLSLLFLNVTFIEIIGCLHKPCVFDSLIIHNFKINRTQTIIICLLDLSL